MIRSIGRQMLMKMRSRSLLISQPRHKCWHRQVFCCIWCWMCLPFFFAMKKLFLWSSVHFPLATKLEALIDDGTAAALLTDTDNTTFNLLASCLADVEPIDSPKPASVSSVIFQLSPRNVQNAPVKHMGAGGENELLQTCFFVCLFVVFCWYAVA